MRDLYLEDINNMEINLYSQSIEYKEFIEALDILENTYKDSDEIVLEAVKNQKHKNSVFWNTIGSTAKTIDTTADIYGNLTDTGASIYRGEFNLIASLAKLVARIVGWAVDKIFSLIDVLAKLINAITDLPETIKTKITGNIQLYITAGDLQGLFNQGLVDQIINYIAAASQFVKGEYWKSFFANGNILEAFNRSDGHYYKQMENIYKYLHNLSFTKTTIYMDDKHNVDIYFRNSKSISYIYHGQSVRCSYYQALKNLLSILGEKKPELINIKDQCVLKVDQSKCKGTYASARVDHRGKLDKSVEMISNVIKIVGQIMKYVNADIKTIHDSLKAVNKKANKQ
jgi:hypothetical protein